MFDRAVRVGFTAVVGVLALACGPKCLTADSVNFVDDEGTVFLVYRVTGIQDKAGFFEAYRGKPSFDRCGKTSVPPLDMQPYEPSEGLVKRVELYGSRLKVVYTHKAAEAVEPQHAQLIVK